MCQDNSSHHHHPHSHHHENVSGHHHHDMHGEASTPLSTKEKLFIRLEHFIVHNKEHAGYYKNLADAAVEMGAKEVAQLIATAAKDIQRQNQNLEKALNILKS